MGETSIPLQLRRPEFRFVLIQPGEKTPFEKDWPKSACYAYGDSMLKRHLEAGGNYGVCTGRGDLCVIDADSPEVAQAVERALPPTFCVKTSRGKHFYYRCIDWQRSASLKLAKTPMGDVLWQSKQAVGPGSLHPSGFRYEVIDDLPIQIVDAEAVYSALAAYLPSRPEAREKKKWADKPPRISTSFLELPDGSIIEEVWDGKRARFAHLEGNGVTYSDSYTLEGQEYVPMVGDALTKKCVLLASEVTIPENVATLTADLIRDIQKFIHKYSDVPARYERISIYFVLHTWLYDRAPTTPILRQIGDLGTGKSRHEDTVGGLCYKATRVNGAVTPAPIYRLIGAWGGTLIIDEADWSDSSEYAEVVKILNSGIEPNRPVMRCNPDKGNEVDFFPVYGPKIVASRQPFKDGALESRCLTQIMYETQRTDIPFNIPAEFYEEQQALRNRLLYYRMSRYADITPEAAALDLKGIEPRLQQMARPFISVFGNDPVAVAEFKAFLVEYQQDLISDRAATLDGSIVNAIFEYIGEWLKEGKGETPFEITTADIVERIGDKDLKPQKAGKRLKALGLKTEPSRDVNSKVARLLVYNPGLLTVLRRRYCNDATSVTLPREIGKTRKTVAIPSLNTFPPTPAPIAANVANEGKGDAERPTPSQRTELDQAERLNLLLGVIGTVGAQEAEALERAKWRGYPAELFESDIRHLKDKGLLCAPKQGDLKALVYVTGNSAFKSSEKQTPLEEAQSN